MANPSFFYDFDSETVLAAWRELSRQGDVCSAECGFESPGGDFILLWRKNNWWDLLPSALSVNGVKSEVLDDFYVRTGGTRYSMPIHLEPGRNRISAEVDVAKGGLDALEMWLVSCPTAVNPPIPFRKEHRPPVTCAFKEHTPIAHDGYIPGAGCEKMPGRFGVYKGDGILDCAVSSLGMIDKMYLCGHPQYKKPFRWSYLTLPAGKVPALQVPGPNDKLEINHLAVKWSRDDFACTYSLASPGIITESQGADMRLSKLMYAGNYRYVLTANQVSSLDDFNLDMPENWLLLFGCSEFPDLPLLVVLDRRPSAMEVRRLPNGRLDEIVFRSCRLMISATPFGIESFQPISPNDETILSDAVGRCRFWSRALLAFPVRCVEYFKNDHKAKKVSIVQEFEYRMIADEWGTVPLKTAPLPPIRTICELPEPAGTVDFKFPTKFGWLRGRIGSTSAYDVKMIPPERRFPLCAKDSKVPDILREGLGEFFDFAARFSTDTQSYAYPGAVLEQYAYAASMAAFMPPEYRDKMAAECAARLRLACDPNRQYTLLRTNHGFMLKTEPDRDEVYRIYNSPDMRKLKMWNYYERTEPFTGRKYTYCYFNVGIMHGDAITSGSREFMSKFRSPGLIENDWGIGITFYMMYSAALASGDFAPIKENWDTIRKVNEYFNIFHDWACMGSGYGEKATRWVEGANYGAFTSFINMAEAVGDKDAYEYGVYMAAKMISLRIAIYTQGRHYLYKFFDAEPWYGHRDIPEEYSPYAAFQFLPPLGADRLVRNGISLLTTDAVYPELFEAFRAHIPATNRETMAAFRKGILNGFTQSRTEFSALLVNNALDPEIPVAQTRADIENAVRTDRIISEWHDIHRYENYLPKNYLRSQLLAWLDMQSQPMWLEHWEGVRILRAIWDGAVARIELESLGGIAKLRGGLVKQPKSLTYSGASIKPRKTAPGKIEWALEGSGTLEINF